MNHNLLNSIRNYEKLIGPQTVAPQTVAPHQTSIKIKLTQWQSIRDQSIRSSPIKSVCFPLLVRVFMQRCNICICIHIYIYIICTYMYICIYTCIHAGIPFRAQSGSHFGVEARKCRFWYRRAPAQEGRSSMAHSGPDYALRGMSISCVSS